MMRIIVWASLVTTGVAFQPLTIRSPKISSSTQLEMERRDVLVTLVAGAIMGPEAAHALSHGVQNRQGSHTHGSTWFFDEQIENVREESQMPTGDKVDLNGAIVVRTNMDHDGSVILRTLSSSPSSSSKSFIRFQTNNPFSFALLFLVDIDGIHGLSRHVSACRWSYCQQWSIQFR